MKLSPMRYKDYSWPHNPRVCQIEQKRKIASVKLPFGDFTMQDLGRTYRVIRGEGEFSGEGAYDEFKKLEEVFRLSGSGILVHPVFEVTRAHFVSLSLRQEPKSDYVAYSFEFWEDGENASFEDVTAKYTPGNAKPGKSGTKKTYIARYGDTMWGIAIKHGLTLTELVALNPQVSDPNILYVGDVITVGEMV